MEQRRRAIADERLKGLKLGRLTERAAKKEGARLRVAEVVMKRIVGLSAVIALGLAALVSGASCFAQETGSKAAVGVSETSNQTATDAQESAGKRSGVDAREKLAGVWRGNSVCLVKDSPCHDEVNVYRFSRVDGKPDTFLVTASKVVDGKEIVMGSGEWKYDDKTKTLESEQPRIRLTILRDNWMEGALTIEGGKEYRKIRLKKES